MKEKSTNNAIRALLDAHLGETQPQRAEPSEQAVHAESTPAPKRISAKIRREHAGGLQTDLPCPCQADRSSGGLFE